MTEKTVVKTMELPDGRDWLWFADLNVVALSPHLDAEGQERAFQEVAAWWRRSGLRAVPPQEPPNVAQPLAMLSPQSG